MRYGFVLGLAAMLLGCAIKPPETVQAESLSQIFKKVHASVVEIHTEHQDMVTGFKTQPVTLPGMGSGVLISNDGMIVTAAHVVQTADNLRVHFMDGEVRPARVVASEPTADVALLKVDKIPANSVIATFGDSDLVEVGDEVFVVGAPAGMSYSMTAGHISARRKVNQLHGGMVRAEFFQTDAAINQGNSGGPMFNQAGEVIGIASYIISKSGGSEGLGFVVTSNMARRLLLERNPFWSGIDGFLLVGPMAEIFNLPQNAGVLIQRVAKQSPAARLGLRPGTIPAVIDGQSLLLGGDIILEAQGIPIVGEGISYRIIRDRISQLKPGESISVIVLRGGEKRTLSITIPDPTSR